MSLEKKLESFIKGLTKGEKTMFKAMLSQPAMEGLFSGPTASRNINEGMFTGPSSSSQKPQLCQHCGGSGRANT